MSKRLRPRSRVLALAAIGMGVALAIGVGVDWLLGCSRRTCVDHDLDDDSREPGRDRGLTGDGEGYLSTSPHAARRGVRSWRVDVDGGPDQAPTTVGTVPAPCGPAGLAFDAAGRLYVTGAGAAGDAIAVLKPSAAAPPVATIFATGTPGANGLAFDRRGNLYASDGVTSQGRVFRVGPAGGAATVLFRVPTMANAVGVGRQNAALQPGGAPAPQNIVANGLALTRDGDLLVADTARGAIWRVELDRRGNVASPTGCDSTYSGDTLCFDDVLVEHPFADGADGIALDRDGNVWIDATSATRSRSSTTTVASRSSSGTRSRRVGYGTTGRSSSRRARSSPTGPCARRAPTGTGGTTRRTPPPKLPRQRPSSRRSRARTRACAARASRCRWASGRCRRRATG
jgi:sugar lactone lactonase YvrE